MNKDLERLIELLEDEEGASFKTLHNTVVDEEFQSLKSTLESQLQDGINYKCWHGILKLDYEKLESQIKHLKEDNDLTNVLDWGDDNQRFCPTHENSYHLYCKACKDDLKNMKKDMKKLLQYKAVIDEIKELLPEDSLNKLYHDMLSKLNTEFNNISRKEAEEIVKFVGNYPKLKQILSKLRESNAKV